MKLGGAISYFIMTCDSFDTRKTNILALCYLFITYKPAYSDATQVTETELNPVSCMHQESQTFSKDSDDNHAEKYEGLIQSKI